LFRRTLTAFDGCTSSVHLSMTICTSTTNRRARGAVHMSPDSAIFCKFHAQESDTSLCTHAHTTYRANRLAGVGLFVQQEDGENIYVSSILPHGAAACCGMIQNDDELLSVDDHIVQPDDDLAEVCARFITFEMPRCPRSNVRCAIRSRVKHSPSRFGR
jgi:hypothetical protein